VDSGIDLSQWLRGAEGVDIRLSGRPPGACETPVDPGVLCRRAYVGIRVYDADLAAVTGTRPLEDLGGQLWVLEIPQTTTRTEPRLLGRFDVGNGVARLQVIPRPGRPDLVAAVARVDDQLWIYDDELGAMAGGVGRNGNGVPLLGHDLIGLAAVQKDAATARLYVSASSDQFVSAVEVSLDPVANTVPVCVVLRDPDTGVETCTPPEQVSLGAHVMHIKGVHP
jgi:hypothetical protein